MALPFRDRVVHHALCNIIEPIFEGSFIFDSYACRKGKGIHAASKRLTQFTRRARNKWGSSFYCLKADISKFFPTVKHQILSSILRKKVACAETIWLMEEILFSAGDRDDHSSCGLPIGNLTSQLWANVYLNELDHFVKEILGVKFYIRYMDDIIILDHYKKYLSGIMNQIKSFLEERLSLRLNEKTSIFPIGQGIDFVGYRTWPDFKLIRKSSIKRIKTRLKKMAGLVSRGTLGVEVARASLASWIGYCTHADAFRVRNKVLDKIERKMNF
jgi:retron-type reverse transcriptase